MRALTFPEPAPRNPQAGMPYHNRPVSQPAPPSGGERLIAPAVMDLLDQYLNEVLRFVLQEIEHERVMYSKGGGFGWSESDLGVSAFVSMICILSLR